MKRTIYLYLFNNFAIYIYHIYLKYVVFFFKEVQVTIVIFNAS